MSERVDVSRKLDVKMVWLLYYFFKYRIGMILFINSVKSRSGIMINIFGFWKRVYIFSFILIIIKKIGIKNL